MDNSVVNRGHEYIKAWRESSGMTLSAVASKLGLHTPALSDKENGKRPIRLSELAAMADLFDVDMARLLRPPPTEDEEQLLEVVEHIQRQMNLAELRAWIAMGRAILAMRPPNNN